MIKQSLIGKGAGRDDTLHRPLYGPFAGIGIPNLLANGHGATHFDQLRQIGIRRMIGHAAHGDGRTAALTASG